jgi:hypothetical protein
MNLERIKERMANGFRPFELQLTNGRRLRVPHREFIMVGKGTVVIMGKDDSVAIVDALHIVSIDDLPTKK